MTEKFESGFHKQYVGGEGEVNISDFTLHIVDLERRDKIREITLEEILEEYRAYVHDPEAELPEIVLEGLKALGKI